MVLLALGILIAVIASELFGVGGLGRHREAQAITVDHAIGVTVEPLDPATARTLDVDARSRGLVVTSVSGNGPAGRAGIRVGDVIERVGSRPARSLDDIATVLEQASGLVTLRLNRHGHYAIVRLPIRSGGGRSHAGERGRR